MRKRITAIFALLLIPCLLFAGCASKTYIEVYGISGLTLVKESVTVEELTAKNVYSAIVNYDIIPSYVSATGFNNNGSSLQLDVSYDMVLYLNTLDKTYQVLTVQAIANTFISAFNSSSLTLTVQGAPLKTDLVDFSAPLLFMAPETSVLDLFTPEPTPTPSPTPEATATPDATPTPTDIKTPKPTPYYTPQREDQSKYVAITFDDGPHTKYTKLIVNKLVEYNAGATFFVVGNRIDAVTGEAIKYAVDNGSEIAIHGYTHTKYYNSCSDADFEYELSETKKVIEQYTGVTPTMMRPIGGSITNARVKACPYSVILWNVDSEDWKHKGSSQSEIDAIVNNVMTTVKNGSIILLHEIYENSYQAFCIIMERLYAEGYKVVTVTELLGENNVKPGTKYYNG